MRPDLGAHIFTSVSFVSLSHKEPHHFSFHRSPSQPLLTFVAHHHCRKSPPPPPQYEQTNTRNCFSFAYGWGLPLLVPTSQPLFFHCFPFFAHPFCEHSEKACFF